MHYLLKSEPDAYSFSDLERDGETVWDGITNPVALKNLRGMRPGDKLIIYHTGEERQAVGTAVVMSVDASDPKNPRVIIRAGKRLKNQRTLNSMKTHRAFTDSPLVKQGRLSVVPLTNEQYDWITET
jgi:predicted RNA-binding protein with PUA-like domain